MTRNKALSLGAGALLLSLVGCGDATEDFIEAEGTYGDGRALHFREQVRRFICDATKADAPCVSLMGLRLSALETEILRGIRISFTPSKMTAAENYASGLFQPVTLYVVQATADRFVDSSVNGGEISFTTIAAAPGEISAGTFRGMALRRRDLSGVDQTLLTLNRGSFQYLQP